MYYYTKDHEINPVVLVDLIKLSSLSTKFESLKAVYRPDSHMMDSVEVYMSEVLLSEDEDILIDIINDYSQSCEMEIRYNLERDLINPAMGYGRELLAKFGSLNVYKQKTDAQIQALTSTMQPLIIDLLTGSLKQAYSKALALLPDENITAEEISEFQKRIGWFLGL
jgi:hypothetical protein